MTALAESRLLAGARGGALPRHRLLAALLLITGLAVALGGSFLTAPLGFALGRIPAPPDVQAALVTIGVFAGIWVGLAIWVPLAERRPFRSIGLETDQPIRRYLGGAAVGAGMFAAVVGLMAAVGAAAIDTIQLESAMVASLLAAAAAYSVQGSAEEALVRGWLLPVASVRFGLSGGMLIQTLVFTVLHGINPGLTPIAVLNLILVSLFLGVWALRSGDIWPVMGWHAAWNWTQGNIFGIAVSGAPPAVAPFPVKVAGPEWLAGGAFGAEASVMTSVVLSVGLLAALSARRAGARPPG
ncbi:MAG: type II CAAX endopeptidase family protein [Chloroflexota bacterium]|nr:CPBP family intramembrane metalloprotease [Dehalococcoidia bacterium]MDW8255105.1 type II CAAX endopeptidase family protein [Chloroflexota bacterium]